MELLNPLFRILNEILKMCKNVNVYVLNRFLVINKVRILWFGIQSGLRKGKVGKKLLNFKEKNSPMDKRFDNVVWALGARHLVQPLYLK